VVAGIFVAVVLGSAELGLESVRGCLVNTGGLVPPSVASLEEMSSRERPLVMAPTPAMVGNVNEHREACDRDGQVTCQSEYQMPMTNLGIHNLFMHFYSTCLSP
jgi:hypothetical protein